MGGGGGWGGPRGEDSEQSAPLEIFEHPFQSCGRSSLAYA